MASKMLGKLETVFSYMGHFFLQSWPDNRPGILFLADSEGYLLTSILLQVGQTWKPSSGELQPGDRIAGDSANILSQAFHSGRITVQAMHDSTWGIFPVKETDGRVRAFAGLILPSEEVDFEFSSYLKGLEPLLLMGYDAYIQHATSEIVMNVNKFDRSRLLVQSLSEQIANIVNKGCCSAVKLSEKGYLLPQERVLTCLSEQADRHLGDIISRLVDQVVTPMVLDGNRVVLFPIQCEEKSLYALVLHLPPDDAPDCIYDERDIAFLQEVGERASYALLRATVSDDLSTDARKKDLLYSLTKKIQASIDVNDVLEEIINSIKQLYPYFAVDLYLTVETNTTLPVKPLSFQAGDLEISTQAYMEGKLVVHYLETESGRVAVVAAPLLGKQGIYGVLQLTANELVNVTENETDYISILAETAGTAFENAQLYAQSRNLIRELRLINEMAQQLNRSLNLNEILQFVTKMLLETFEAEYCAILRKLPDEDSLYVMLSSIEEHVGKIISSRDEPLADIFKNKQALILANPSTETMPFSLVPFASMMGVPLLREAEVSGVLLVSDSRPHFFSFDDYKLLEIFGQHTSLAITNAMLHNEVERMVITDNLTGLYSRRYLNERVRLSIEQDSIGSLILMDIDYFKRINDTFGHQVGDEVLIQVANLIKRNIRESDIAARWGGEELAIYLPKVDIPTALSIAERIRICVEAETEPHVTISCGVAKWSTDHHQNLTVETLFHHADIALYEAKNKGRNRVILA